MGDVAGSCVPGTVPGTSHAPPPSAADRMGSRDLVNVPRWPWQVVGSDSGSLFKPQGHTALKSISLG